MEDNIKNSKTMGWKGHMATIVIWVIISVVIPFFVIVKISFKNIDPIEGIFRFVSLPFVLATLIPLSIILYWLLRFIFTRKSTKQLVEKYLS